MATAEWWEPFVTELAVAIYDSDWMLESMRPTGWAYLYEQERQAFEMAICEALRKHGPALADAAIRARIGWARRDAPRT